ncbi:hypothetical protein Tdes44962_MAKER07933 [Teratosphaeria destructans]|uniref:Uncharacterized protein n=1 Tax=Teratosphaeria destructans TaxID=418781 RepID=A0A9W7SXZ8_9PEZI|nr:hypothetical protein Tdes44962_MAKER07933 [Teratosphaeria destructans]
MTSNAFKLTPAALEAALQGVPEDLKNKRSTKFLPSAHLDATTALTDTLLHQQKFGGPYSAAQLLAGGPGIAWRPEPMQATQLRTLIFDLGQQKKAYPSPQQLGQAMQDLGLWTGWRAMDRKMAVKVLRHVEGHVTGRKLGRAEVEDLVEGACAWVEMQNGEAGGTVNKAVVVNPRLRAADSGTRKGEPDPVDLLPDAQPQQRTGDDNDERDDGDNNESPDDYDTALQNLNDLMCRLGLEAVKDRATDADEEAGLVERAEAHLAKLKVFREKSKAILRRLNAERKELDGK